MVRSLMGESAWVREHQNLFLIGPTGVGKTWLARAFAHKACRDGYTALFLKAAELFRDLAMARADGSHGKLMYRFGRVDLLIVDDWAMAPMTERSVAIFSRSVMPGTRPTRPCSPANCRLPRGTHIGDPTVADSILDRLVHNAHRMELSGESIRKKRKAKTGGRPHERGR